MHLRFAPIALLVAALIPAFGQADPDELIQDGFYQIPAPANPSTPRRNLSGTVVNSVTGEPIRRALVRVNGPQAGFAFSAADGRFEIPNVGQGQIYLTAQKPGFFGPGTPQPGVSRFAPINFGAATGDIVLKMQPEATVRGHVLDKRGEPIESLNVQLLFQAIAEGRKEWQFRGQATTDDTGAFAIENLFPGQYLLRTLAIPSTPLTAGLPAQDAPMEVFPPTIYPETPGLESAQGFELKPGQDLSLDLSLSPVPGFRVSGTITGGALPAAVICQDEEGQPVAYGMASESQTGKFTVRGVPNGSWTLHAFSQQGQQDGAAEALLPIQVTSSDIHGLVLQIQPLATIAVHVSEETANQNLHVRLTPAAGTNQNRRLDAYQGSGDATSSLSLHGVPPGRYQLSVQVPANSVCPATVMSGSIDLLRDQLTVSSGAQPAPVEITLRHDCAAIYGTIHASSDQPANASVVLLPDAGLPIAIQTGTDGKFSLPNLTPGAYRLYAFNDISDLEYANPEALRDFTGQSVTVGPNEKTTVQLDLITRGK